jgi:3-deoxy-manno-octulosonate cytidylyltransferase (CMP-KDO synthetase)
MAGKLERFFTKRNELGKSLGGRGGNAAGHAESLGFKGVYRKILAGNLTGAGEYGTPKDMNRPIIIIPARMASTRLPEKPLADIHGEPMIVHVWQRTMASKIGPVVVACDSQAIADVIVKAGGKAILTNPDHPSGSDRIWEALNILENQEGRKNDTQYDAIINVQGDLPLIDPAAIKTAYDLLRNPSVDIATLAVAIKDEAEKALPQIVKAVFDLEKGATHGRALYFSRLPAPSGDGPAYHHVGLYAYRREALARFVKASPSPLEQREKLEQLRALALGMHIEVGLIDSVPLGVDTSADLETVRNLLRKK